jgi:hypothetical protein
MDEGHHSRPRRTMLVGSVAVAAALCVVYSFMPAHVEDRR